MNILLHLTSELLLVPAQPAEGGVSPAVEPLVYEPAGRLRDGEDEESEHHLHTEEEPGAELPLEKSAEAVGGDDPRRDDDDPAGGQGSSEG